MLAQIPSEVTSLGVGTIAVVLILQQVFGFLKNRSSGRPDKLDEVCKTTTKLATIMYEVVDALKAQTKTDALVAKEIKDLHEWHNIEDDEGVKIWYVRKSLQDAIQKLAENIERMTELLRHMHEEQKAIVREVRKEMSDQKGPSDRRDADAPRSQR